MGSSRCMLSRSLYVGIITRESATVLFLGVAVALYWSGRLLGPKIRFCAEYRKKINSVFLKPTGVVYCLFLWCMKNSLYLDHAASTPMYDEVIQAMQECMLEAYGNPMAVHEAGRQARVRIEQARRIASSLLGLSPGEVFFTSGGTEGINTLLWSCARDLQIKHFISSPLEHPAVLKTLESLRTCMDVDLSMIRVDSLGHVDLQHLEDLLGAGPESVVCLMHANNETGNLLPVNDTAALCKAQGALFFSDTVQTMGKFRMDFSRFPVDLAVGSAHKFHGPKGAGLMVIRDHVKLRPLITGGGQERLMRAGTENLYGIVGQARALERGHRQLEEDINHIRSLKEHCMRALEAAIPDVRFNGDARGRSLHTILNVSLPPRVDPETLLLRLDMAGICLSSGSACGSGVVGGSKVLQAMGVDPARPALRISFSAANRLDEINRLVETLKDICH